MNKAPNITYIKLNESTENGLIYKAITGYDYYSKRYKKHVEILPGMLSDGATGAFDIISDAWWVHDKICNTGVWADGSKVTNFQCSMVLSDILRSEGRLFRSFGWFFATFLFGGGKARENGMFYVAKKQPPR